MDETLNNFLNALDGIGFGDEFNPISGADCIDTVAEHLDALRKLAKDTVKKKYTLIVDMNTDDDVMIEYMDCLYCFYRENLHIAEQFDTINDVIEFIENEIKVQDGYKATDMTKEWLYACCNALHISGDTAPDVCGNQEYSMYLNENTP